MAEHKQAVDLVVFGATSFVGKIICRYLLDKYGTQGEVSWAIAGRNENKLNELCQSLGGGADKLPRIIADAADEQAMRSMCSQSKVIMSTVGPYALYGEPLVKACAETGTDYVDLTGEPQWIMQMQEKYEEQAKASGARIVHCCGFDSVPSDLGVFYLQQQAQTAFGAPCTQIKMRVKAIKGGASGGTVASILNLVKQATSDPKMRKMLANPYALCPPGHGFKAYQYRHKTAQFEKDTERWIAPFIMSAINERVVHRSNALQNKAYGERFIYDEAMFTGKRLQGGLQGWMMTLGLGSFMLGAAIPPIRWGLEKFVLPKPGEGPSESAQENGFYDIRMYGTTDKGETLVAKVTGDKDPGYGSTAKIISEAAVCLAKDEAIAAIEGGFGTPASVFGETLIGRLQDNAGLTFSIK